VTSPTNFRGATTQKTWAALRTVTTLASLALLVWFAWGVRHEVTGALKSYRHDFLILSILAGVVFTVVQAWIFALLVIRRTAPGPMRPMVAAFLLSQPSKYVPGKIWPVFVQAAILGPSARPMPITLANLQLFVISLLHLLALGLLCIDEFSLRGLVAALLIGPVGGAMVIALPVGAMVKRIAPRFAQRTAVEGDLAFGPHTLCNSAIGILVSMVANLLASSTLLLAIGAAVPHDDIAKLLAILYLSNILGALVVVVPAGIGIREAAAAALGAMLVPGIPASLIVTAAVMFRLWQIAVDVLCFALGWILNRQPDPPLA